MLGEGFSGTLVSDRWSAYVWVHPLRRQVHWAHLLRKFEGFAERKGVLASYGQRLLDERATTLPIRSAQGDPGEGDLRVLHESTHTERSNRVINRRAPLTDLPEP